MLLTIVYNWSDDIANKQAKVNSLFSSLSLMCSHRWCSIPSSVMDLLAGALLAQNHDFLGGLNLPSTIQNMAGWAWDHIYGFAPLLAALLHLNSAHSKVFHSSMSHTRMSQSWVSQSWVSQSRISHSRVSHTRVSQSPFGQPWTKFLLAELNQAGDSQRINKLCEWKRCLQPSPASNTAIEKTSKK